MLRRKIIKSSVLLAAVTTGLHFEAEGWKRSEQFAADHFNRTKEAAIGDAATYFGYVPAAPVVSASVDQLLDDAGLQYQLAPALLHSVAHVESRKDRDAESFVGALGVMQVMPDNYKTCGLEHKEDLLKADNNINCGAFILSSELSNRKSLRMALKVYNCGAGTLKKNPSCGDQYAENVINGISRSLR